jgi:hypothetical protein
LDAAVRSSLKVRIPGLNGEIYAEGLLAENGHPAPYTDGRTWHVNLKAGAVQCSSRESFRVIKLQIGDLHTRPGVASDAPDQKLGSFNIYDPETSRADIKDFGAS